MDNTLLTLKNIESSFSSIQEREAYLKESSIISYDEMSKKSEASLLDFLKTYGVSIDLKQIDELSENFLSAKDLTHSILEEQKLSFENPWDAEMITLAMAFLWNHRKENEPLEFFDVHLHDGYLKLNEENEEKAEEHWSKAALIMKKTLDRQELNELTFIEIFDDAHVLSDWVDDFNQVLFQTLNHEALLKFQDVMFRVIKQFETSQSPFLESFHLNYAQSFYYFGETLRSDATYKEFLSKRPKWKNGWLRWADNYLYGDFNAKDAKLALEILEEALDQVDEEDKTDFFQRLKKLYLDEGAFDKVREIDEKLDSISSKKSQENIGEDLPFDIEEIQDDSLKEAIKKNKLRKEDMRDLLD